MARPRKSLAKPTQVPPITIAPRVLNARQAADYIGASLYAIETLWSSGEVRSYLQSGKRVCDVRELDAYIDRRNQEPAKRLTARALNLGVV